MRIALYVVWLLPEHAGYHNLDGSITDPTELDETERHLQYLVSLLKHKGEIFLTINVLNGAALSLHIHRCLGQMD